MTSSSKFRKLTQREAGSSIDWSLCDTLEKEKSGVIFQNLDEHITDYLQLAIQIEIWDFLVPMAAWGVRDRRRVQIWIDGPRSDE